MTPLELVKYREALRVWVNEERIRKATLRRLAAKRRVEQKVTQ